MSAEPTATWIPAENPELEARIVSLGSYLLSAATTFFFISFLFAFLYLRALNSNGLDEREADEHDACEHTGQDRDPGGDVPHVCPLRAG